MLCDKYEVQRVGLTSYALHGSTEKKDWVKRFVKNLEYAQILNYQKLCFINIFDIRGKY